MNYKLTIWTLAITVLLLSACSNEEEPEVMDTTYEDQELIDDNDGFATWDQDQDQNLTSEEFGRAVNESRTDNTSTDNGFNDNTFRDDLYTRTDINRDDQINEDEFTYVSVWLIDEDTPIVFGNWDKNNNNVIERSEFDEGWASSNRFKEFDKDGNGVIDKNEYIMALYGIWDLNNDGRIGHDEFQKYSEWHNSSETADLN